jgi:poly [ADP-ribose] polymerase
MGNIIKEAKLVCVSLENNSNKLYWLTLYDNDTVRIQYGRYSELFGKLTFQHDDVFPNGEKLFNKKLKEKLKPGRRTGTYVEQPIVKTGIQSTTFNAGSLEQIALQQIKTTDEGVHVLIKNLVKANVHNVISNSSVSYDVKSGLFSTPVGLITKEGIDRGRDLLSLIKDKVDIDNFDSEFSDLAQQFLSIIPRDFGRRRVDVATLFPQVEIQKQLSVLDSLEVSLTSVLSSKPGVENEDIKEKLFDTSLEIATPDEFSAIQKLFIKTAKDEHQTIKHLTLVNVYKVNISNMSKSYESNGKVKGNIHRLWHGSSVSNILSILKSGFLITPPSTAKIAGKNFGPGSYFSPISTKSLQYSNGYWGSGSSEKVYLFLNDVAVGKAFEPASTTSERPPSGYDSYWAKAGKSGWLINDEVVVFDTSQIKPLYLLEFSS